MQVLRGQPTRATLHPSRQEYTAAVDGRSSISARVQQQSPRFPNTAV